MGLLNLKQFQDDMALSANDLNEQFGKVADVLNGNVDATNIKDGAVTAAKIAGDVLNKIYPVGSLYFNATNNVNPGTLLGFGAWEAYSVGKFPVGYDASQTEFNAAGVAGGNKTHWHYQTIGYDGGGFYAAVAGNIQSLNANGHSTVTAADRGVVVLGDRRTDNGRFDGTADASSLPPYQTVYIWRRTS